MIDDLLQAARTRREELASTAESAAKIAVAVGGISYAVGLIVVNGHLLRYGVHATGALRADYVMAGLLWAVLTAIAFLTILGLARTWSVVREDWRNRRLWLAVVKGLLGTTVVPYAFFLPLLVLSGRQPRFDEWWYWSVVGTLAYSAGCILLARLQLSTSIRKWAEGGWHVGDFPTYEVAFQCFVLLSTVGLYSRVVYPSILPMYGGGRPSIVRLVGAPGSEELFQVSSLSAAGSTGAPASVELIAEVDDWLIVRRVDNVDLSSPVIRLRRDMVVAVELVAPSIK
jgi:hypothetical protein